MGVDPWGFDEGRQVLARRLRDSRLYLSVARTAASLAFLVVLLGGGSVLLRIWAESVLLPGWASAGLFLLVLYALWTAIGFPFALVSGYRWEKEVGLTDRSLGSWLWDHAKGHALGLIAFLAAGEVVLWLLDADPGAWWIWAWLASVVVSFGIGFVAPVLLVPLFFRSKPLADPALRERLEALAASAGTPVIGAFELGASSKTRRSNAGVMGLGRTRRIVVTDTLLREYSIEEIESVLAHELGHERFHDRTVGFLVQTSGSLVVLGVAAILYAASYAGFGVAGPSDMAGLPLLAFCGSLPSMALGPFELWWSRRREARADGFALRLAGKPDAFASAIAKLHDKNLGVAHPRRWETWLFHSHPPGRARVEMARSSQGHG